MNNARIKMPSVFKNKSKNEIKNIIESNIYNENKKDIAIKYYVYEECQIDIAMEYEVDRNTIGNILKRVIKEIEEIA